MACLKISISGKVYHTGYRYFLKQKASQLNITGYVFYCTDHSVEIFASGEKLYLDLFITYCRIGNNDSLVKEVCLIEIPSDEFDSFEVVDVETLNY